MLILDETAPPQTVIEPQAETDLSATIVRTRAQIVSCWGPLGSTGKTSMAINVAFELANAANRVLLIDLDTYAPSIETQLNLIDHPAGLAAACRLASQDRLTEAEILRLSQTVQISNNNLSVMTGISSPARWPEISPDKIDTLLDVAANYFDFIILDVASEILDSVQQPISGIERNAATIAALQNSNIVLTLGSGDPIGIRRYILARQELKSLRLDADIFAVINRVRTGAIGHKPKVQISDTLMRFASIEVDAFVPDEPATFDQCIRESIPLAIAKRKSAARQSISAITKRLILAERNELDERVAKIS